MFNFEEYLISKRINKPFILSKAFMKVKGVGNEIHCDYIAIIVMITIFGLIYS